MASMFEKAGVACQPEGWTAKAIDVGRYGPDDLLTAHRYARAMPWIAWLRDTVHRPLFRAVTVGLSIALIVCSFGAMGLRMRHDVSLTAVVRYFTRAHLNDSDLSRLLRNSATGLELEALLGAGESGYAGGLVYVDRDRLAFHPHSDPALHAGWISEKENRALYARLVPLYHHATAAELVGALASPDLRRALAARGIDLAVVTELEARLAAVRSEADEIRLLRWAGRLIQPFTPSPLWPAWLDLGDTLRFYETAAPAGRFVGQFAVLDAGWGALFDAREARELSRHSHYILVTRTGDRILVLDFFRGRVQRYDLRPFDHQTGNRLFRLTIAS